MHLKKRGYASIGLMFTLMIITLISAFSCGIVINNKREKITVKYNDLYNLGSFEEALLQTNLYLKNNKINLNIEDGRAIDINKDLRIIYYKDKGRIQINYNDRGSAVGRFFRYKLMGEYIILFPEEGKYEE